MSNFMVMLSTMDGSSVVGNDRLCESSCACLCSCSGVLKETSPVQKAAPTRKRSRIEDSDSEEEVDKVEEKSADSSLGESSAKLPKHEPSDSRLIGATVEGVESRGVAEVLRTPPKRLTARKHTGKVNTSSAVASSSVSYLKQSIVLYTCNYCVCVLTAW